MKYLTLFKTSMSINRRVSMMFLRFFFLRIIAVVISPYLSILSSCCLELAIFQDCFKIAKFEPIYKTGLKFELTNYRRISLLLNFSKILEKIIAVWILAFLDKHRIFNNGQSGFRKKHSTMAYPLGRVVFYFFFNSLDGYRSKVAHG